MKNEFCPINFDCDLMADCNEFGFCPNYSECLNFHLGQSNPSEQPLPYDFVYRASIGCLRVMPEPYTFYPDAAKEAGWCWPCQLPYRFDESGGHALIVESIGGIRGANLLLLEELGYKEAVDLTPYYCYWAIAKQSSNFREFQEAILNFDIEEDCLIRYCQDINEGEENMLYKLKS